MKLSTFILFAATLNYNSIVHSSSETPQAPSLFDKGPTPITAINLKTEELISLMLLDSALDLAKPAAHAAGCESVEGNYSIEITADGALNKPETNLVKILSPGNEKPLILNAALPPPDFFHGQNSTSYRRQAKRNEHF